ncbi:MAG: hypothetical protein QME66_04330 [Candidatus Eisenbacteria bacterium]|nr:hypothetical protein [Candidatus Eisenbacteria bacterium]
MAQSKVVKVFWTSKTFWVAVLQAVAGVLVALPADNPELGGLMILKSLLDVVMRFLTKAPVTL